MVKDHFPPLAPPKPREFEYVIVTIIIIITIRGDHHHAFQDSNNRQGKAIHGI
jgi:hypothetical protein